MKFSLILTIPAGIIAADQLAKIVVIQNHWPHRLNTGGAFSLLAGFGGYATLAGWALIVLLTVGFWLTRQKKVSRMTKTGWALLIGGALSNTLDRLLHGGVLDFLQIGLLPNFNLADVAITLGLVTVTLALLVPPPKATGR